MTVYITAWDMGPPSVTSYIHTHWKLNGLRPAESDDGEEGDGPAVAASYRWVSSIARNQPPRQYRREATFDRSCSLCPQRTPSVSNILFTRLLNKATPTERTIPHQIASW